MNKKYIFAILAVFNAGIALLTMLYLYSGHIAMLNPKGLIAMKERDLMIIAIILMLIVVIPVFILTIAISWHYRAGNSKAKYTPDWDYNLIAESLWWGFPCVIILVLSVITWKSSYDLDPFKPIDGDKKPITIQVVALQWKWLFIYPEQNIATVNFIQFPEQTPLNFEVTADAPMNSFWIPQLGGQIYAMPAMKTKLHLIANEVGSFRGSSANLSGKGFSGMMFEAKASTQKEFDEWIQSVKQAQNFLSQNEYQLLAKPSEYHPITFYTLQKQDLFDWIVMKSMTSMP